MKEDHEIISDEELNQFFLYEALLLCPSARADLLESERLWILHVRIKRLNKLLGVLLSQVLGEYFMDMQEAFSFYFVEKNESKKKKHRMNEHLNKFNQFIIRMTKLSVLIDHYCQFNTRQIKSLERVIKLYFPGDFQKKQREEVVL